MSNHLREWRSQLAVAGGGAGGASLRCSGEVLKEWMLWSDNMARTLRRGCGHRFVKTRGGAGGKSYDALH
eukprot:15445693-Alexandrium_andersonii.AAC.1